MVAIFQAEIDTAQGAVVARALFNVTRAPLNRYRPKRWEDAYDFGKEDTLKHYLTDPHEFIPGEKMIFAGIKNEEQIDDLIVYLRKATQ
jgi:hypothetical protein